MRRRDWPLRVQDMLEAIARIQSYVAGMSFDEFRTDAKTVDAVVRNIEILGEAANSIDPEIRARHLDIPWREIRAVRNIVAHAYFGVSLPIIWQTINEDLDPLVPLLHELMRAEDEPRT